MVPTAISSCCTQLRRAAVDHVSDLLYDIDVPLSVMSDAAKAGNRREMEDCARAFQDHCTRIEQVYNSAAKFRNHISDCRNEIVRIVHV